MDKKQSDMDKKPKSIENEKRDADEAAEAAAKTGLVNRFKLHIGQKMGYVEWTKIEPRFERNIDKLISYHNIIYKMVDAIELQVQVVPKVLAKKHVLSDPGENPWEMMGGWLNYLAQAQFQGAQKTLLEKYSKACGKICQKEIQIQKRTRSHLIRKMRMYTGDESEDLNESVDKLKIFLHGIDTTRNKLKSSKTTNEVKERGEAYRKQIKAFNEKANEIQAWIDEVAMVVSIHEQEILKFSREVSVFHDSVYNSLNEVLLRLGYRMQHGKK